MSNTLFLKGNVMVETRTKKVSYELIKRDVPGKETPRVYVLMDDLIDAHHPHLVDADIALYWKFGWKADTDGSLTVVKAMKASDIDRAGNREGHDFAIALNHEVFNSGKFTEHEARYWIDHALECCKSDCDNDGEQKEDENGNNCWRVRKPSLQLFPEVYARHGCVLPEMAHLRNIVLERQDADRPLLKMLDAKTHASDDHDDDDDEDATDDARVDELAASAAE